MSKLDADWNEFGQGVETMANTGAVPLEGKWTVTQSDRKYDWIGPNSSIPYAGNVFRSFDQYIPFTFMIRMLRRWFGLGHDSMNGTYKMVVRDCGASLDFMGRTFTRTLEGYESTENWGGTLHTVKLTVVDDETFSGLYIFSLGDVEGRMSQKGIDQARAAGVDLEGLKDLILESDLPFDARFSDSEKQRKKARKKQNACDCERNFKMALVARVLWEGYRNNKIRDLATNHRWSIEKYIEKVEELYFPVLRGVFGDHGYSTKNFKMTTGASVDEFGKVSIEGSAEYAAMTGIEREALIVHEVLHVRQNALKKAVEGAHNLSIKETPYDRGVYEEQAYGAQLSSLLQWLEKNCNGDRHADKVPDQVRDLYLEAQKK